MDFIETIQVPLTRTATQQLRRYAKALGLTEAEAAGRAVENYLNDMGALELRVAAAHARMLEKTS